MYPKKQIKPQLDTEVEDKDLFKKTKKAISKKAERDWVIVDADSGEDVTHLWQKDIKEGMTRQDAEEMFGNDSSYYVSDKYKKSDLKFIKKYGLEDIDNRTWSSVDPEADTEFGTCDLTGKKGPLVRMKALDKNGGEVEMEVLEDIAHKLHGLSGPY